MEHLLNTIINSIDDGFMVIDYKGTITHFNTAAGRIMGISPDQAIGRLAVDTIPNSRLHLVLKTGMAEVNQEQFISEGIRIVTTRKPVFDGKGKVIGAVCFFRDITETAALADQNTSLKKMRSLLEAVIAASQDAVSVVDEKGIGIIINPAYTRLTGFAGTDIIGKPAEADISEGESVHMQVLKTGRPVIGAHLKVGPQRKEVIVNAAPIMVDGDIKGSVGIIHDVSELRRLSEELTQARRIIRVLEAKYSFKDIVGESLQILNAISLAKRAARLPATVLLRGESGTGKELFAHAIHNESNRKNHQFIRINCAAIIDSLFESELFGYEGGSFTGAKRGGKKGLFEEANGGTIFLDEISELSMNVQAKMLRVLQEKEIVRVGGTKSMPIDVRIIAATHEDLHKAVKEGRFREDLYYRLNVMPIEIPPLCDRKGDIAVLAGHIIRKLNQQFGRNITLIEPKAMEILEGGAWRGNIRELENVLVQCVIKMQFSDSIILREHLPALEFPIGPSPEKSLNDQSQPLTKEDAGLRQELKSVLSGIEKQHIMRMLAKSKGNKTDCSRKLGISIRNLYNKLEKYQIGSS